MKENNATAMIDLNKPMRMHFTHTDYVVEDAHVFGGHIYAISKGGRAYYKFSLTGQGEHPCHKLVNEPEPKRTFIKKIAWIEYWKQMCLVTITPEMELFGVEKYLKQYVPGKCIAITEIACTEGEGNPPKY